MNFRLRLYPLAFRSLHVRSTKATKSARVAFLPLALWLTDTGIYYWTLTTVAVIIEAKNCRVANYLHTVVVQFKLWKLIRIDINFKNQFYWALLIWCLIRAFEIQNIFRYIKWKKVFIKYFFLYWCRESLFRETYPILRKWRFDVRPHFNVDFEI